MPATLEAWKGDPRHSVLWGYNAPAQPLYLAGVYGYLYEVTREPVYATRAAKLLTEYGSLRDILPAGFAGARAEYGRRGSRRLKLLLPAAIRARVYADTIERRCERDESPHH